MLEPVCTMADSPAARSRPARSDCLSNPMVDVCAAIRRIQALAAEMRQELQRWPRGRRIDRAERLIADLDTVSNLAAMFAADAAARGA